MISSMTKRIIWQYQAVSMLTSEAFFSVQDRLRVTSVQCSKCNCMFDESLKKAIELVREEGSFLCIQCDPLAEEDTPIQPKKG